MGDHLKEPPEKILLESAVRALQLFVNALKYYVKAKFPQDKDSQ